MADEKKKKKDPSLAAHLGVGGLAGGAVGTYQGQKLINEDLEKVALANKKAYNANLSNSVNFEMDLRNQHLKQVNRLTDEYNNLGKNYQISQGNTKALQDAYDKLGKKAGESISGVKGAVSKQLDALAENEPSWAKMGYNAYMSGDPYRMDARIVDPYITETHKTHDNIRSLFKDLPDKESILKNKPVIEDTPAFEYKTEVVNRVDPAHVEPYASPSNVNVMTNFLTGAAGGAAVGLGAYAAKKLIQKARENRKARKADQ